MKKVKWQAGARVIDLEDFSRKDYIVLLVLLSHSSAYALWRHLKGISCPLWVINDAGRYPEQLTQLLGFLAANAIKMEEKAFHNGSGPGSWRSGVDPRLNRDVPVHVPPCLQTSR